MKQITTKGRMLLRKILTGLSLGAVAVTFQACYGMPQRDTLTTLRGIVKSSSTDVAIQGIKVTAYGDWGYTDSNGKYQFSVDRRTQTVLFEDIDGEENGEFQDKEVSWDPGDGLLNVSLDPK